MGEKHKKYFPPPTRPSGQTLADGEPQQMGSLFLKKFFTPHVYVQNDQRVMGIILRYVCWGTHRYPPGAPAADWPTPPPPDPPKFSHMWGSIFEQANPLRSGAVVFRGCSLRVLVHRVAGALCASPAPSIFYRVCFPGHLWSKSHVEQSRPLWSI